MEAYPPIPNPNTAVKPMMTQFTQKMVWYPPIFSKNLQSPGTLQLNHYKASFSSINTCLGVPETKYPISRTLLLAVMKHSDMVHFDLCSTSSFVCGARTFTTQP